MTQGLVNALKVRDGTYTLRAFHYYKILIFIHDEYIKEQQLGTLPELPP